MTATELNVGDQVTIARAGTETLESSCATVRQYDNSVLLLEADQRLVFIRPGVLLMIRLVGDATTVGWASVEKVQTEQSLILVHLSAPRWESSGQARAARLEVDYRVVASFVDASEMSREAKRTVGQAMNLSMTGVRIRVRTALPRECLVHLQLFIRDDSAVVAIGRVARIIEGSEAAGGGFEVGLSFVRFLSGYDDLMEAVGNLEANMDPEGDEFGFTESDKDTPAEEPGIAEPAAASEQPEAESAEPEVSEPAEPAEPTEAETAAEQEEETEEGTAA